MLEKINTETTVFSETMPLDDYEWYEATQLGDPRPRWVRGEPKTVSAAQSARLTRNQRAIENIRKLFDQTIDTLVRAAERDELENVDFRAQIQTTDVTKGSDAFVAQEPGPWRRIEVVWEERKASQ